MDTILKQKFFLLAQNRGDQLLISSEDQQIYCLCYATEILAQSKLLEKFSAKDAAIIGYIAGMANAVSERK